MNRAIPPVVDRITRCALASAALLLIPRTVTAQDAASCPDYVSRSEYDKLKAEHEAMKKELEALKTAVRQMANGDVPGAPAEGPPPAASPTEGKQVATAPTVTPSTAVEAVSTEASGPLATHGFSIVGDAEVQFA